MGTPLSPRSVVSACKEQLSSELSEEIVILNVKAGIYYGLDPVGTRVWKLVQTPRTVAEILEALLKEFDAAPADCEQDLMTLLGSLAGAGLIEVRQPSSTAKA